jgi:hypothetical protein
MAYIRPAGDSQKQTAYFPEIGKPKPCFFQGLEDVDSLFSKPW